jgi:hypothetical protein
MTETKASMMVKKEYTTQYTSLWSESIRKKEKGEVY